MIEVIYNGCFHGVLVEWLKKHILKKPFSTIAFVCAFNRRKLCIVPFQFIELLEVVCLQLLCHIFVSVMCVFFSLLFSTIAVKIIWYLQDKKYN